MIKRVESCRICGSTSGDGLSTILDFGYLPLANALLDETDLNDPEPRFPLKTVFCAPCSLLQITESLDPELLFREYVYLSGFSDSMKLHWRDLAEKTMAIYNVGRSSLVLEAASNDGYLLQYFVRRGIPVLGIDPARNIAPVARSKGVRTITEFFNLPLARRIVAAGHGADVFLANNVLAHVPDLNDFVAGIRLVLKDQGAAIIEVPYVRQLVGNNQFDTIYHEHLYYFSLTALQKLFARHDLEIVRVNELPVHGGTLQVHVRPQGTGAVARRVDELLDEEAELGIDGPEYFRRFADAVRQLREQLLDVMGDLKSNGRQIAAYGASAKGSTLLNYCGIGRESLEFMVDRNPLKQGRYAPGSRVSILHPAKILDRMPDFVLLLSWNLRDEILEQQKRYRSRGGKFLIPIPEPVIA